MTINEIASITTEYNKIMYLFNLFVYTSFHQSPLKVLVFPWENFIFMHFILCFAELDMDYLVDKLSLIGLQTQILDAEEYFNGRIALFAEKGPIILCSNHNTTFKVLQKVMTRKCSLKVLKCRK